MIDDQEFQSRCDEALRRLDNSLGKAADTHGFEVEFSSGAIKIEFEDPPARFVVSPNSPVRQIWLSAHSKSYKFDWDAARGAFAIPGGATLQESVADAIATQLGEPVIL
jgi:CyaY protein